MRHECAHTRRAPLRCSPLALRRRTRARTASALPSTLRPAAPSACKREQADETADTQIHAENEESEEAEAREELEEEAPADDKDADPAPFDSLFQDEAAEALEEDEPEEEEEEAPTAENKNETAWIVDYSHGQKKSLPSCSW